MKCGIQFTGASSCLRSDECCLGTVRGSGRQEDGGSESSCAYR